MKKKFGAILLALSLAVSLMTTLTLTVFAAPRDNMCVNFHVSNNQDASNVITTDKAKLHIEGPDAGKLEVKADSFNQDGGAKLDILKSKTDGWFAVIEGNIVDLNATTEADKIKFYTIPEDIENYFHVFSKDSYVKVTYTAEYGGFIVDPGNPEAKPVQYFESVEGKNSKIHNFEFVNDDTHEFLAWRILKNDGTLGDIWDFNDNATEDLTLVATYKTYSVEYLDGNNVLKKFTNLEKGVETPTIANPTKEGYKFVRWNPEVSKTVEGNATYMAIWEKVDAPKTGDNTNIAFWALLTVLAFGSAGFLLKKKVK